MITKLAISGYRSLRDISLNLENVNIVTGENGSGKSNIYKALSLLADTAQGELFSSLAKGGGFPGTLWAGPETLSREMKAGVAPVQGTRRKNPVALKLAFASDDYSYAIDLGLPPPTSSAFSGDPEIKSEHLWHGDTLRPASLIAKRTGTSVSVRNLDSGEWIQTNTNLASFDSMMTHGVDPSQAPEILAVRETMRNWRFYDHFRSDKDAPARQGQYGTRAPALNVDGSNIAACIETISEIGDINGFLQTIDDAFPGSHISVESQNGIFDLRFHQKGLLRPLSSKELSDGTLRFILWAAALTSPRPPDFLVLNEPETSLHVDLLEPLARLISRASVHSQLVIVTHAARLIDALNVEIGGQNIHLKKDFSETTIPLDCQASWTWPNR